MFESLSRTAVNQANAQHSTGPRTQQGKATSSRNALTHGLYSMTGLLPGEDQAEFDAYSQGMLRSLRPFNANETELVNQLIDIQWRLRRASTWETRLLSAEEPDFKALNNMSLHAARLKRQFTATLKEFTELHEKAVERRKIDAVKADTIYNADAILNRPSTLGNHGFEFTLEELELWRSRISSFLEARKVVEEHENRMTEVVDENLVSDLPLAA